MLISPFQLNAYCVKMCALCWGCRSDQDRPSILPPYSCRAVLVKIKLATKNISVSAFLMNTPKIWFLEIRFLRIALKRVNTTCQLLYSKIEDRSLDPWTRRHLSHPGDGNSELANAPLVLVMPYWCCLWLLHVLPIVWPILSLSRSTSYNMQCQFNKDI